MFVLARQRRVPVYTDDRALRILLLQAGIPSFGTPALLDALVTDGRLSVEARDSERDQLRRLRGVGVTVSVDELVRIAERADWAPSETAIRALADPAPWKSDFGAHAVTLIDFLRRANRERPDRLRTWTRHVLVSMTDTVSLSRAHGLRPVTQRERILYCAERLMLGVLATAFEDRPPWLLVPAREALRRILIEDFGMHYDPYPEALEEVERHLARLSGKPGSPLGILVQLPLMEQTEMVGLGDYRDYLRRSIARHVPPAPLRPPLPSSPTRGHQGGPRRRR